MSKTKPLFIVAIAVAGISMISADCNGQVYSNVTDAPSVAPTATAFNYPAEASTACATSGCNTCRTGRLSSGGHLDQFKANFAKTQANAIKVMGRNQAWPMPFNCADRQLYFSIWEPMIDQGFEEQCVLTSIHFDGETNQLNQFGKHTVAGIMQNMPSTRREVFIHRQSDDNSNQARRQAVESTINTWYASSGPARVSFSTKLPVKLNGSTAEAIMRLSAENQAAPVIPVSSGESVSDSVGN